MKNTIDHYHINNFVKNHVIDNILVIESQDPQFIAISNIYHQLKSDYPDDISQNNILLIDLVTKISLISYQI